MQVEIINSMGIVSYRRPHTHKDVGEALQTMGYTVRVPADGMRQIFEMPMRDGRCISNDYEQ